MEVTIAFSYPKMFKIGAKLISLWMGRPYSHVLIHWKANTLDRTLVYQASHGSVHFIEMQNFLKENNIIKSFKLQITDEQFTNLVQTCVDLAGQPYAVKGVILLGFYEVLNKLGIKLKIKDSKGYFCSELLANLLITKYNHAFDKPLHLIKPSDIDDFLTTIE